MSEFVVTQEMIDKARGVRPEYDYFCIDTDTTPLELLAELQCWDKNYPQNSTLSLSTDGDRSGEGTLYVNYQRPETDSEVTYRLRYEHMRKAKEAAVQEAIQQRELAEYKRLAAKYGELK